MSIVLDGSVVTPDLVRQLRDDAADAGDLLQVMICDRALNEYEPLDHATPAERKAMRTTFRSRKACAIECARVIIAARAEAQP